MNIRSHSTPCLWTERLIVAVDQTCDGLSRRADLMFGIVHPLIDDRDFLRIGAQQVDLSADAAD